MKTKIIQQKKLSSVTIEISRFISVALLREPICHSETFKSLYSHAPLEFSLIVFTELAEFSDKIYYILKRLFQPATSCVRDQDTNAAPLDTGSREDLESNSCFSDLSDSLNSLNFRSI